MDVSVFSFFYKVRMVLEVVCARMLKDKITALFYYVACIRVYAKHFIRDGIEPFDTVWGIGKYNIERFGTDFKKIEHIVAYYLHTLDLELGCTLFDESCVKRVHLNAYDVCTSS